MFIESAHTNVHIAPPSQVIEFFLRTLVFPRCTSRRKIKIQASGTDISADTIFHARLGMSGTPSSMEWPGLDYAVFNKVDQAKTLKTLTDPSIMNVFHDKVFMQWTVKGLLREVASSGRVHALIDTGALITGFDNREVAQELLEHLPPKFHGVAYLNEKTDAQTLLLRVKPGETGPGSADTDPLLKDARVPMESRFTFYDQIHTTGVDIKQAPNAVAAITLNKGMTYRDLAQGAWRMRQIGVGQKVSYVVVREVSHLINEATQETHASESGSGRPIETAPDLMEIVRWLLRESMRIEEMQNVALSSQSVRGVYRKAALKDLFAGGSKSKHSASGEIMKDYFAFASPTAQAAIADSIIDRSGNLKQLSDLSRLPYFGDEVTGSEKGDVDGVVVKRNTPLRAWDYKGRFCENDDMDKREAWDVLQSGHAQELVETWEAPDPVKCLRCNAVIAYDGCKSCAIVDNAYNAFEKLKGAETDKARQKLLTHWEKDKRKFAQFIVDRAHVVEKARLRYGHVQLDDFETRAAFHIEQWVQRMYPSGRFLAKVEVHALDPAKMEVNPGFVLTEENWTKEQDNVLAVITKVRNIVNRVQAQNETNALFTTVLESLYKQRLFNDWDDNSIVHLIACILQWFERGEDRRKQQDLLLQLFAMDASIANRKHHSGGGFDDASPPHSLFMKEELLSSDIEREGKDTDEERQLATPLEMGEVEKRLFASTAVAGDGDEDADDAKENEDMRELEDKVYEFKYTEDFDDEGIMRWLGTNFARRTKWVNPAIEGEVVTCSFSKAVEPCDSWYSSTRTQGSKAHAPLDRRQDNERRERNDLGSVTYLPNAEEDSSTGAKGKAWWQIEINGYEVNVENYSLRSGAPAFNNNYGYGFLQHWRFEGSIAGTEWVVLREHGREGEDGEEGEGGDPSLDAKKTREDGGGWKRVTDSCDNVYPTSTWSVRPREGQPGASASSYYRFFRIVKTGSNGAPAQDDSCGPPYHRPDNEDCGKLYLGGFELYGKVRREKSEATEDNEITTRAAAEENAKVEADTAKTAHALADAEYLKYKSCQEETNDTKDTFTFSSHTDMCGVQDVESDRLLSELTACEEAMKLKASVFEKAQKALALVQPRRLVQRIVLYGTKATEAPQSGGGDGGGGGGGGVLRWFTALKSTVRIIL